MGISVFSKVPFFCACSFAFFFSLAISDADILVVKDLQGVEKTLRGEVVEEARDNSVLFQTADGQLKVFRADQIVSKSVEIEQVAPLSHEKLGAELLNELPDGFGIHSTEHYVIAYQTNLKFAKWVGKLYEARLYKEFQKFARRDLKKFPLNDPKFILPVIVFQSKPEYERYAIRELGGEVGSMIAHYNQNTNRVAMYDLTFDFGRGDLIKPPTIDQMLFRPEALPMVATVIHEGTHQLMYNRGMQTRMADGPLWLNEGLANWFETPNRKRGQGWRFPGLKNQLRLGHFRLYLPSRPADSLSSLIASDARFADAETAIDAYAESWSLVTFLLKTRAREFREYLLELSRKRVGIPVDEATRIADFVSHFGDLQQLDRAFLKYMYAQ